MSVARSARIATARRPKLRASGTAALLAAVAALGPAAPASARDQVVSSFDGAPIATSYYPADGLRDGRRAPTILRGHGFGGFRDRAGAAAGGSAVGGLRAAGYNVLTWDARGFGQSGGTARFNDPDVEGRDVRALIDFAARQPEALLDGPGDPRVGMTGSSYAGDIQLVTAALDSRVDAITPTITWSSLLDGLWKDGAVKSGWLDPLVALGTASGTVPGLVGPAGVQPGAVDPRFTGFWAQATLGGRVARDDVDFLAARDRAALLARVRAPTLLVQGTADGLFSPSHAIANYEALQRGGAPTKMVWQCEGHGPCRSGGDRAHADRAVLAWLARYVKRDGATRTGPAFEWLADDARWRSARTWPPAPGPPLAATGGGALSIVPGPGAGAPTAPTPAPVALRVGIPVPAGGAEVVGAGRLQLGYSGRAVPARTWLYAQLVDRRRNLVVGNQATPIPVTLDGASRTVVRPLEAVALHATSGSRYELQLVSAASAYAPQRALGRIRLDRVHLELPVAGQLDSR